MRGAKSSILCSDQYLRISRNLSNLLYQLRGEADERILWIDQLCINQNDKRDKEQQLELMGKVYQEARDVVFWIGSDDEHTPTVFGLIEKLDAAYRQADHENSDYPPRGALSDDAYTSKAGLPSLSSGEWKPLMDLLALQVFRRLWIVQEIALAPSVVVLRGSHIIDFEKLGGAASYLAYSDWISTLQSHYAAPYLAASDSEGPIEIEELGRVDFVLGYYSRRIRFRAGEQLGFEQLLLSTRRYKTNRDFRHDKVYALLGLLSAETPDGQTPTELKPSYSKSASTMFQETTQYLLNLGSLDILSGVEDMSLRPANLGLPSWVPNYDVF